MNIQPLENVMIDLETLATSVNCVILSIGACGIDSKGDYHDFYEVVNIQDNLEYGREVESGTITWWLGQAAEARKAIIEGQKKSILLNAALESLSRWIKSNFSDKFTVWSNGASFDISILANAYKSLGIACPWKFWQERCFRTVKEMFKDIKSPVTETAHNALDDAQNQLEHLNLIIKAAAERT